MGGRPPELDAAYIRAQMRTLLPMVKECYENALLTQPQLAEQHLGEVKQCYEAELERNPQLAGRVVIRFTIGSDGKVQDSRVAESSLKDAACESCIAEAVLRWEFPKLQGGIVVVNYPFALASGEKGEPSGSK